jgi:diguanylate cyclase (GGDEF)-like protein
MIGRMNRDLNRTIAHLERTKNEVQTDDLTQLPNRVALQQYFHHHHFLPSQPYVMFFLDVNQFKSINDTYGHLAGDQILREVADELRTVLPDAHTVYRLSGDEFVVLGPLDIQEPATAPWQHQLHARLAGGCIVNGQVIPVSVSVGHHVFCPREAPLSDVMAQADAAMYDVKKQMPPGWS